MGAKIPAHSATELLRRIRGVTWRWRKVASDRGLDVSPGELQAGVVAQEVQAVFPELVAEHENGYLTVDYPGLVMRLAPAIEELSVRLRGVKPSDALLKSDVEPVAKALERLEQCGGPISSRDLQALVGALVEAVKELDSRVAALEGASRPSPPTDAPGGADGLGGPAGRSAPCGSSDEKHEH